MLFAFIFGIGLGGDYMIIPLMAAELFGVKVMGRIMGIILTFDGLAEAFSPMLVGWLRDRGGSYANGFAALMILGVIGIITVSLLPFEKNAKTGQIRPESERYFFSVARSLRMASITFSLSIVSSFAPFSAPPSGYS